MGGMGGRMKEEGREEHITREIGILSPHIVTESPPCHSVSSRTHRIRQKRQRVVVSPFSTAFTPSLNLPLQVQLPSNSGIYINVPETVPQSSRSFMVQHQSLRTAQVVIKARLGHAHFRRAWGVGFIEKVLMRFKLPPRSMNLSSNFLFFIFDDLNRGARVSVFESGPDRIL